jgi:TonB-dependent starch-binding outer membrane protein SusC
MKACATIRCLGATLLVCVSAASAQTRTITGRITSAATGSPLPSAEIRAGGAIAGGRAAVGTLSGLNGTFSLAVPAGETRLTISSLGYKTQTVTVAADQTSVLVSLEADPLRLDEIVVTGQATGIQRRNLANAVSKVSSEQLNIVPSASIETQLAAKVAGADVQANSGAPGGGNQINLRGVATIFGSPTPLYVVDGVVISDIAIQSGANTITNAGGGIAGSQDNAPNRIADLNPADIESIEILKGGSAAAIYGSKANNGVILITTRRGRIGETRFSLSQRIGFSQLANQLGTRTYTSAAEAIAQRGNTARDYLAQFNGQLPGPFDLEKQLAPGRAPAYETSLNVSGGTDRTRFYASGLAHNEDGVVTGTFYKKYSLALNLDQKMSDRLSADLRSNMLHSETARGFTGNDNSSTAYYVALAGTPSFIDLRRRADGTYPQNVFANSNPLQTAEFVENTESVYRFIGSSHITYELLQNGSHTIRLLGIAGADVFQQNNTVYAPEDVQFECIGPGCSPVDQLPGASVAGRTMSKQYNFNVNAVHTFTPGSNWHAITSFGLQYEYTDRDIVRVDAENLFPGQRNVNQAVTRIPEEIRTRAKDLGFYVQEEVLLFNERLLLTGSVRGDRSSNNVATDQWFYYPKGASSYRVPISQGWVDELKLRIAYGQSGLQPQYGQKFNNLNPGSTGGLQTLALGNSTAAGDLRPERQSELEAGLDASLFGGRMSLELTGYHQRVDDLILTRNLAPSTGYGNAVFNNDGYMTNRGIEAALHGAPLRRGNLSWNTDITFSLDRSKMDSLSVPAFNAPSSGFGTSLGNGRIEQGKSLTQISGRDTSTVVDDPRCLEALATKAGSGLCPAGTRFVTKLGDANPDFRMGFANTLRYKGVALMTTFDWQRGGKVINLLGWLFDLSGNTKDYMDPCNVAGCQPGETLGQYRLRIYPARTSKVWLENASFLKLREVALAWQVPSAFLQSARLPVQSAGITLSGRNLIRITNYRGMDPEVHNFGSTAIRTNVDVGPYPPSRSFWLSADVRF